MPAHSTLLIFNPNSDRGRSGQKAADLRVLVDQYGGADWRGTEYPGHAVEIAAAGAAYQTVAALGGDGTVHEVVNGLMQIPAERRPRLGLIPIGSGNDFAFAAGVPANDPAAAARRLFQGAPRPIDIGHLRDGAGRTAYFHNSIGIGFDAAINIRSRTIKYLYGFAMYLTATLQAILFNFEAPHMRIAYDDGVIDQPVMMLTIGNGSREGGGFLTTPDARPDDGRLDFMYVHQLSQFRMLQLLPLVMKGTHVKEPDVSLRRATYMTIDADRAIPVHLDGELFAPYELNVRHLDVKLLPGALQVL